MAPYLDTELDLETRVKDLVSRLTLEEKITLIPTRQAAVERLGIKEYNVGGEAAHGYVDRENNNQATVFPQPTGLACTWDPELMKKIGEAISDEVRVYYRRKGGKGGLTLWAPTVDLARDPRWGRNEETYGEDPYLTANMAGALVKGMQGSDPRYLKMGAALKHFYANNNETERYKCSVSIDPRNKREYYWEAFRPIIEDAKVCSIMTAYNEVNGVPCIVNSEVKEFVKGQWGLNGFVVGDGADFQQTVTIHKYFNSQAESIAATIKSGIDCIPDDPELIKQSLLEALDEGLLKEEDIDRALSNIFRVRFRLGQFDPDEQVPYTSIPESVICSQKHSDLAREAARKSIVLLKNEDLLLPLGKSEVGQIAAIGPLADVVYRDWYTGIAPYEINPLQALKNTFANVTFEKGFDHIVLKHNKSDKYLCSDDNKNNLIGVLEEEQADAEEFELEDWGWNKFALCSQSSGKYMITGSRSGWEWNLEEADSRTFNEIDNISTTSKEIWGWYVKELFSLYRKNNGSYRIKTWNGKDVLVGEDNYLQAIDSEQGLNEEFELEIVKDGIEQAVEVARKADTAIVFVGNHPLINGKEEIDRPGLSLPEHQRKLIKNVCAVNPRTVLVIISSYPVAINWAKDNVPAIIYSSHGGQELGNALVDVIDGSFNPAGKLNMTWYKSESQLPALMEYDIIKGKRTYMYFDGAPLYPFGHGLSYTEFKYSDLKINSEVVKFGEEINLQFYVKNNGSRIGTEVIQLYIRVLDSRVKRPIKQLKGFNKQTIEPGKKVKINFTLSYDDLKFWDVTRNKYCVESGEYLIMLGSSSTDIRLRALIKVLGEEIPLRDPANIIFAKDYDDYHEVYLTKAPQGGETVVFKGEGSWVSFHQMDFSTEFTLFEASIVREIAGSLELRVDSPKGKLIATLSVKATKAKDNNDYSGIVKSKIKEVNGQRDIYLLSRGIKLVEYFKFK